MGIGLRPLWPVPASYAIVHNNKNATYINISDLVIHRTYEPISYRF